MGLDCDIDNSCSDWDVRDGIRDDKFSPLVLVPWDAYVRHFTNAGIEPIYAR